MGGNGSGASRASCVTIVLSLALVAACGGGPAVLQPAHVPPRAGTSFEPPTTGRASLQAIAPRDAADASAAPAMAPAGPQDLRLALVPSASTVAPDGVVWLEARVTNTTPHPLALSIAIPESIEATNEQGARNPAPRPPPALGDTQCAPVVCAAAQGSVPHAVRLPPGEAVKVSFPWKAEREIVGAGCCPQAVRVGPLLPGKYTLSLDVTVEGLPVLVSSTQITVRP